MKGNKHKVLSLIMAWAIVLSTFSGGFAPLQAYAKDSTDQPSAEVLGNDSSSDTTLGDSSNVLPEKQSDTRALGRLYAVGKNKSPYHLLEAPAPLVAGSMTIEFDATSTVSNPNTVIGLIASDASASSDVTDMNVLVRFNGNKIDSHNGSVWASKSVPFVNGTVYRIKITVNMTTKTYDVWVTPAGGSTVQLAEGNQFRKKNPANIGKIGAVDTRNAGNDTKEMWIDNVTLSSDTILKVFLDGEPYLNHGKTFTLCQSGIVEYTGTGQNEIITFGTVTDGTYEIFVDGVDSGETITVSGSAYLEIDLGTPENKLIKAIQQLLDTIIKRKLKEEYYTPETWTALTDAMDAATTLLGQANPTVAALQPVFDDLKAAYEGLVEKVRAHGIYKAAYADYFGGTAIRKGLGNTSNGASFSNGSYSDPGDGKGREAIGNFHEGSEAATYKGKPGAGVTFPFEIQEDGNYGFLLRFSRINYEIEDYISVYVNYDQVPKNPDGSPQDPGVYRIPLTGKDSEIVFVDSDEWELNLKQGDKISLVLDTASDVSGKKVDKGLVNIDYLSVWEVEEDYTYDLFNRTFYLLLDNSTTNDNIIIPEPGFTASDWTSSDPAVATVDPVTGEIEPVSAGFAEVIATGIRGGVAETFAYNIHVKTSESELVLETTLVSLWDINANTFHPEAKEDSAANVKGFIPILGSGFSGTKEDNTPAVDGVDRVGSGYVDTLDHCPVGSTITMDLPSTVDKAGLYNIHLNYAKGSSQATGKLGLLVNGKLAGTLFTRSTPSMTVGKTNAVIVFLEPGDTIGIETIVNSRDSIGRFNSLTVTENVVVPPLQIILPASKTIDHQEQMVLDVTTVPENATRAFDWNSDTNAVATFDNLLIGQEVGSAVVTAQSIYNSNVKADTNITVSANASVFTLKSDEMTVYLDKDFPRAIQYVMKSGNKMEGNRTKLDTVRLTTAYKYNLNTTQGVTGSTVKDYKPQVICSEVLTDAGGNEYVEYTLTVTELSVILKIRATVDGNVLKFDFVDINDDANKVYVIELPDHNPVTVNNVDKDASFAGSVMESNITRSGDTHFMISDTVETVGDYLYAFVSNGKVAASIKSNAFGLADVKRVFADSKINGDYKSTSLRSGSWMWRFPDATKAFIDWEGRYGAKQDLTTKTYYDEPYTNPDYANGLPHVWVVLAEENNNDGVVDWQDGANEFRKVAKVGVGSEKIADAVVQRLIMSQGNETNYPYLASLDETKRIAAHTDGLGQIILQKYHNAGNWGDFSVYDDQLGGLAEFNEFTSSATNDYNSFVGVHTNWTEYFAKVKQFSYENVEMQSDGITPRSKGYKAFGYYLHQCYVVDDHVDALTNDIDHDLSRNDRMKQFKTDIPDLGFIYSDVYSHNGWRGKELGRDYEDNGLAYFVEWPYTAEDDAVWAHWSVEKSYSPATLKGYSSDIARFVFNDAKDRWDNYATDNWKAGIEDSRAPSSAYLLMGADTTSYEGWVHNGINEYDSIIEKIYRNNIPSKYMQHFPIIRMETNDEGWANYIAFEDGVEVYSSNRGPSVDPRSGSRIIEKDGKKIYEQACVKGNDNGPAKYLIPWDEGDMYKLNTEEEKEIKLYHWNDTGGSTTWELPDSWSSVGSTIYMYELSDQGKTNEVALSVSGGQVTINATAKTPYVVFKNKQDIAGDKEVFQGKFELTNPGFSAGLLGSQVPGWTITKGAATAVRNDNTTMPTFNTTGNPAMQFNNRSRNWELAFRTSAESEVTQAISGLEVGQEYAISVMVEVARNARRKASLAVDNGSDTFSNYADSSILINYDSYDSKARTGMLRMRVVFTATATTATIRLHAEAGSGEVRFDNVRVYETTTPLPKDLVTDGAIVLYQDYESAPTGDVGGSGLEINKPTYEGFFPFNLGNGGGFREARTIMQRLHAPYTQNNTIPDWNADAPTSVSAYVQPTADQNGNTVTGQWWDTTTIPVDLVVDGERSFSNITGSAGIMYQTTPQSIRFEPGKTYRISFDYQTGVNGIFAFVLGAGSQGTLSQNSSSTTVNFNGRKHSVYLQGTMGPYFSNVTSQEGNPITAMPSGWDTSGTYRNSSNLATAVPNWRGYYEHTFTSDDAQTWFGIFRNGDNPQPGDNPNPFIIDNLLIVEVGATASGNAAIRGGNLAGVALGGNSFASSATIAGSTPLTVTIPATDKTNAPLQLIRDDVGATMKWVKGSQPAGDSGYTQAYPANNRVTVANGDIIWVQVTAADGTKGYYKIAVTVTDLSILTVSLTSGVGKVTLAPQPAEAGFTYHYTTSATSTPAPLFNTLISTISAAKAYTAATDIVGSSGTPIYIQVYKVAADGKIKAFGEANATPGRSNDAKLSALSVSSGQLTPAFHPDTINYTVNVPNAVDSITITATANDSGATLIGTGTKALGIGENLFPVVVTAADGNKKTYTIEVTRAKGENPPVDPPVEGSFTITFDSDGGTAVPSQTVKENAKVAKPANPTRSDYTFVNWYVGSASGVEYNFAAPVTGNLTLVAKWSKNSGGSSGGNTTTGSSGGSGGRGSADVSAWVSSLLSPKPKEEWITPEAVVTLAETAKKKGQTSVSTKFEGTYGIKADAWSKMAGLRYEHSTVKGNAVQTRIYLDKPEQFKKNALLSAHVQGAAVNKRLELFKKWFKNEIRVIELDQKEDWESPVKLAAKVDLKGMNLEKLVLYSYNATTHSYRKIDNPNITVDANGYIHFTTLYGGTIILSEGLLEKR